MVDDAAPPGMLHAIRWRIDAVALSMRRCAAVAAAARVALVGHLVFPPYISNQKCRIEAETRHEHRKRPQ